MNAQLVVGKNIIGRRAAVLKSPIKRPLPFYLRPLTHTLNPQFIISKNDHCLTVSSRDLLTRRVASVDQALRLQFSLPDQQPSVTVSHSELSYHCTLYLKAGFITLHSPTHKHTHIHAVISLVVSSLYVSRTAHFSCVCAIRLANFILLNTFNCPEHSPS